MNNRLKPYQLVEVLLTNQEYTEQGKRSFIGEVMSFAIQNGNTESIMIRRVPGHPGTLFECPMDQVVILPPHRKYRYVQYAAVKGMGTFPVDMLRYDSCVPVNFELRLRKALGLTMGMETVLNDGELADLIVARVTPNQEPHWTIARWSSFMWGLRHIRTERIGEMT